jgi:hypothetical protein
VSRLRKEASHRIGTVEKSLYSRSDSWYSFLLEAEAMMQLEGLGKLEKIQ